MVSLPAERIAFWDISLDESQFNSIRRFVSAITIEYEVNSITKAQIEVQSISYLENYFGRDRKLKIKFGWSPTSMITMFSGKIDKNPEGSADDFMRYTITALDDSASMTKKEKTRTFPSPIKQTIITTVAGMNGYVANVLVADAKPIAAKEMPMQKAMTDLEFIVYCARKWNCVTWIDSNTRMLYFMDSNKAHLQGDAIHAASPIKGLNDLAGPYSLGYKTDYVKNNVARVSWKFGKPRDGNVGNNVVERRNENGKTVAPEDFIYEFFGQEYKFSPEVVKKIKSDPGFAATIISKSATSPVNGTELSEYWVKHPAGDSKTNKDKELPPAHKINALIVDVDLNKGDPNLRPPRKAKLVCGSENPRAISSNLPNWLVNSGPAGRIMNVNKVKTQLTDGMIKTSMELSL